MYRPRLFYTEGQDRSNLNAIFDVNDRLSIADVPSRASSSWNNNPGGIYYDQNPTSPELTGRNVTGHATQKTAEDLLQVSHTYVGLKHSPPCFITGATSMGRSSSIVIADDSGLNSINSHVLESPVFFVQDHVPNNLVRPDQVQYSSIETAAAGAPVVYAAEPETPIAATRTALPAVKTMRVFPLQLPEALFHEQGLQGTGSATRVKRRSRMGCLTCRRRKKRCDENRPLCEECKRLRLNCSWPEPGKEYRNRTKKLCSISMAGSPYSDIKVLRGVVEYKRE